MIFAVLAVIAGAGLVVWAGLSHRRSQNNDLDRLMGMTPTADEADAGESTELSALADRAVELADQVFKRVDRKRGLSQTLERARIPLRPGEFVIVLVGGALGVAAVALLLTSSKVVAAASGVGAALVGWQLVRRRVSKRRKAFEAQLPDALGLVGSSLSAGHTFLRAIQMMCEESGPPMSEEFERVVAETRLGDPLVESLQRMATRLQIRDFDMVVQAIRIQQSVGGRMSDLLHTLGEFIRARDEVRREVKVLTAEGRMSAYVLAGLVPGLFLLIRVVNPDYIKPLYAGWGLVLLIGCGVSVFAGMLVILRMVKIEI